MSHRKRSYMRHKMWKLFREQGGSEIEISQDPLGDRYEVNKFGIIIEHQSLEALNEIRERVLATLLISGWDIERTVTKVKGKPQPKLPSMVYATFPEANGVRAYIDLPYEHPAGGARVYVGVTS